MNSKHLSLSLVLLLGLVSTSVNADVDQTTSEYKLLLNLDVFPKWFQKADLREKKLKKKSKIKIAELEVDQKVLGKAKFKPKESNEFGWAYHINIGTKSPIWCYVFTRYDGPATSMYNLAEHSLNAVSSSYQRPLSETFNYAVGSGVVADAHPYLLHSRVYVMGEGADGVSGILKAAAAETDGRLAACLHNEVGYHETFKAVFESFVSAIAKPQDDSDFFRSIIRVSMNGTPVGFIKERFTKDQDGDVRVLNDSAMVLPVDQNTIVRTDSHLTSWSRPDGSLINAMTQTLANGALASDLAIRVEDGIWTVSGVVQDKEVGYKLEHDAWLLSAYGNYTEAVALLNSEQEAASFKVWLPDADPSRASEITLSKIADGSDSNFKYDMGPISMELMMHDNGAFSHGTMLQGPMKIQFNSIYLKGKPTL